MSDAVERIYRAIESLRRHDRADLFDLLRRRYHFVLDDDREKFARPWHDPRNGFGPMQTRLLARLDGKKNLAEIYIIKQLWEDELEGARPPAAPRVKPSDLRRYEEKCETLRVRLRQLQHSTNRRLFHLRYRWKIVRPRNGWLKLTFLR
jgi:hypothetical protein